ncbi:MAG: hypothetical protein K0S01_2776 [Herbinix sp.]|jgi:hypothetical protein|nr:hypothetical protein [Herbinix sp.]
MASKKTIIVNSNTDIEVDTGSGSMAYNRFEMQVSQTLHMAIEIFDNMDYLLVMDYYDDISLFDKEENPETVSYYQMKTNEESISISTAITKDWLVKMYAQLENTDWLIKELGLVTNCPLIVTVNTKSENGKDSKERKAYTAERTAFMEFNPVTVNKIKEDIAKKKRINVDDVDLTKFFHIRTTLSIPRHREILEQEMGEFLHNKYPRITMDSVKTIFSTMMDILTRRQQYELLNNGASFSEVRGKKGISKSDFERVIEEAMIISIPTFEEVERVLNIQEDKYKASYEYILILSDAQTKSETFTSLFKKIISLVKCNKKNTDETFGQYANKICYKLYLGNPDIECLYNRTYVSILVASIIISEMRRTL